jgi:hypothetical protein
MCFALQWQLHISRSFLCQDGTCATLSPIMSASDAAVFKSITLGPAPSLVEQRAAPNMTRGDAVVCGFKSTNAEQWLIADALNSKALKVRASVCQITIHGVHPASDT